MKKDTHRKTKALGSKDGKIIYSELRISPAVLETYQGISNTKDHLNIATMEVKANISNLSFSIGCLVWRKDRRIVRERHSRQATVSAVVYMNA